MDALHTPQFEYTPEDRVAVRRLPVPHWIKQHVPQPVPHKTVHVEGELNVRECRALFRGIKHHLTRHKDVTLTHELRVGYVKTSIS